MTPLDPSWWDGGAAEQTGIHSSAGANLSYSGCEKPSEFPQCRGAKRLNWKHNLDSEKRARYILALKPGVHSFQAGMLSWYIIRVFLGGHIDGLTFTHRVCTAGTRKGGDVYGWFGRFPPLPEVSIP